MKRASGESSARRWRPGRFLIRLLVLGFALSSVLILAAGVAAFVLYDYVTHSRPGGESIEVEIPEGASGQDIGRILAESGLLEHEGLFRLALWIEPPDKHLRHGTYKLTKGMCAVDLLHRMEAGPERGTDFDQIRVTIPEGLSLKQMAALFDDSAAFLAAASDPTLVRRLGVEATTLEGYLMPNTYFFDAPPSGREMVERMVAEFETTYEGLLREMPHARAFDKLTIVTVASLVEEEAKMPEERPLIAAVIYNRLDHEMPLQLDATLQFALEKYGQRLTDDDKAVDSPYNTYQNRGLPPGPISNPGVEALAAAMAPAEADYLYFVSNADGTTHTFSRTLEEHNRAVAEFRRNIAPQRRALEAERGSTP